MGSDRAGRPEVRPIRLFVAVDVPREVKDAVASAIEPFTDRIPGARWTRPSAWHVTLKFLGNVWPRLVDPVREGVAGVAAGGAPFVSAPTVLGAFPSPRRARVLWAGLADPEGRFAGVAGALDAALASDFPPERRPFVPHLTVARLSPPRTLSEFAPGLEGAAIRSAELPVDGLVLYRSHLSPTGARYEALAVWPLGGRPV